MDKSTVGALVIVGLIGAALIFAAGSLVGSSSARRRVQRQAIAHGVATYERETSEFKWLDQQSE